jgi:hypothetical protein
MSLSTGFIFRFFSDKNENGIPVSVYMLVKPYLGYRIYADWSEKSDRLFDIDLVRKGIAIDYHYVPGYGYTNSNGYSGTNACCSTFDRVRSYVTIWFIFYRQKMKIDSRICINYVGEALSTRSS